MGFYLGHYLIHRGRNNEGPKRLFQWVRDRLEGWKLTTLSIVGRITMASFVVNCMFVFHMQSQKLPVWVHKRLDRAIRQCVWNSFTGSKRIHLLSWDVLCRPKEKEGVGLR